MPRITFISIVLCHRFLWREETLLSLLLIYLKLEMYCFDTLFLLLAAELKDQFDWELSLLASDLFKAIRQLDKLIMW